MKKRTKVLIISGSALGVIAGIGFLSVYFTLLYRYKGRQVDNPWSKDDPFSLASVKTLQKKKGKDFVILNFADIQLCDLEDTFTKESVHRIMDKLVSEHKPDLITLTGDQTWSNENLLSLRSILRWLESYKVPYAPVFGNHDHGNEFSSAVAGLNYCCDLYEDSPHCLFSRGPTNIDRLGNYPINIVEEGKVVKTLYFLDLGYFDSISHKQRDWFCYTADGIENELGYAPEGMMFTHKDFPSFRNAYKHYLDGSAQNSGDVYANGGYSYVEEDGFVELAKQHGVTDFLCGHQHWNNFTIQDNGARFTFCLKTGPYGGIYQDDSLTLSGGTVITIGEETKITHHLAGA